MSDTTTITVGQRFGSLMVIGIDGRRITCRCNCAAVRIFAADALIAGDITSCGCQRPARAEQGKRK